MHLEQDFVLGIDLEAKDSPTTDHLGLVHDLVIPDPTEVMLKGLADEHDLDRKNPQVASVLAKIGDLKRNNPDNSNVDLRAHHHIKNLLRSQR